MPPAGPHQLDLLSGPCGDCRHLDARSLASGVCYCRRLAVWRWPHLTVDCPAYRPGERPDIIARGRAE